MGKALFAPHESAISVTPKVWPVIGTGVHGSGMDICAKSERSNTPDKILKKLITRVLPTFSISLGITAWELCKICVLIHPLLEKHLKFENPFGARELHL